MIANLHPSSTLSKIVASPAMNNIKKILQENSSLWKMLIPKEV